MEVIYANRKIWDTESQHRGSGGAGGGRPFWRGRH